MRLRQGSERARKGGNAKEKEVTGGLLWVHKEGNLSQKKRGAEGGRGKEELIERRKKVLAGKKTFENKTY